LELDDSYDRFVRSLGWDETCRIVCNDDRCAPCVKYRSEEDYEPCSKNAIKMVEGAKALIAYLEVVGVLPGTLERLSELGGVNTEWGHWYRTLDSEPFDREGAGSLALICCKGHGYRIKLKLNSLQKLEMIFNSEIREALHQHDKLEQILQADY
jgi:hypothetical protein